MIKSSKQIKVKKCKYCGNEFITNKKQKFYCKNECFKAQKYLRDQAYFSTLKGREVKQKSQLKRKDKKKEYDKSYFSTPLGKEVKRRSKIKRKEHITEQTKEYQSRPEIHEKRMAQSRAFKHTDKGRANARYYGNIRRGRKEETTIGYTKQEWMNKMKATNGFCPICNRPFTLGYHSKHEMSMDHNPPISKAGKRFVYTIDMISPLCRSCNSKKGNRNI
jgi:5-methylcytosine-specific restriction endonuclease McrA